MRSRSVHEKEPFKSRGRRLRVAGHRHGVNFAENCLLVCGVNVRGTYFKRQTGETNEKEKADGSPFRSAHALKKLLH